MKKGTSLRNVPIRGGGKILRFPQKQIDMRGLIFYDIFTFPGNSFPVIISGCFSRFFQVMVYRWYGLPHRYAGVSKTLSGL